MDYLHFVPGYLKSATFIICYPILLFRVYPFLCDPEYTTRVIFIQPSSVKKGKQTRHVVSLLIHLISRYYDYAQ
jgi:Ni,Fe-hydrogenase I cytochrome b subunit